MFPWVQNKILEDQLKFWLLPQTLFWIIVYTVHCTYLSQIVQQSISDSLALQPGVIKTVQACQYRLLCMEHIASTYWATYRLECSQPPLYCYIDRLLAQSCSLEQMKWLTPEHGRTMLSSSLHRKFLTMKCNSAWLDKSAVWKYLKIHLIHQSWNILFCLGCNLEQCWQTWWKVHSGQAIQILH